MTYAEKEKLIRSDILSLENRVRHTFNQGYDLGYKDGIKKQLRTGHWIYKTVRGEKVPCCSRCGLDNGTHYEYNFCPECGAKMVECEVKE